MTTLLGRSWKFDKDLSSDQLISANHVFEFDARMLRHHLLAEVKPELAKEAKPGDIIVSGGEFAHGSIHSHPFIAMKALGLGLLTCTLSRAPFRLAIFFGIPFLIVDKVILEAIHDQHTLSVDFTKGIIVNETTHSTFQAETLSPFLQNIVDAGGGLEYARLKLNQSQG